MIGLIEDGQDGAKLAARLAPGQALVSREGAYWRWDGYHMRAEATDRQAVRLEQQNRRDALARALPAAQKAREDALAALEDTQNRYRDLKDQSETQQKAIREADSAALAAQSELTRLGDERARLTAETSRLEEALSGAGQESETRAAALAELEKQLAAYDEASLSRRSAETDRLRAQLQEVRAAHNDALRQIDQLRQDQSRRAARLHAIADERLATGNRAIRARARTEELTAREAELAEKLAALKSAPKDMDGDKSGLLSAIAEKEKIRDGAAEKLATAESELAETARALKEAEAQMMDAREARAAAQALTSSAAEQQAEMVRSVQEQFGCRPEDLKGQTDYGGLDESREAVPDVEKLRLDREKAVRSRDQIGPVNLRAELEAEELEKELGTALTEKGDLEQAIAELREAIAKLNEEARERLTRAFDQINAHFKELFVKLFRGGSAELKLIESDDPLQSGLEIFAQPPGKSLQSLSLLSGGEQTLASIALIFAMFLTNPSPICVLDEIDAPLDDANVDRVCDLLDDIAGRGETRFLIITHHRLTMARMDRLYGVTMSERGVSQLVSVDLKRQMDLLEAA